MIGKRIGERYEIIRVIGDGGMSRVYLAHDVILDRDVAIKVLHYDFANEEDLKRRFQREALSATSLTHPHIVNIFDVGQEGELHYLVMEYIPGRTLKEYIQMHGPLPPAQAVEIMQQLVSAISHAHHNGIVHRDIKPQNILMDTDTNVKITDFGIAMALNATAHTKTNSVIGTVHYLSPEQARGGMATKRSDIYSLGIVFYELLTGTLPFSAETAVAIALKHLQEETPSVRKLFPHIPQSVENVILKATAKDALHRYASADEMYEDLLTVLSPERADEEKFVIPFDDDRTVAIPVVKDVPGFQEVEGTKIVEPPQPKPAKEQKKKRKKWPYFLIGGMVVIGIVIALLSGMFGPKEAVVPDVIGMEEGEATEILVEEGFVIDERMEEPSSEYEEGIVFRTIPEAGKKRTVGTPLKLFISTGKDKTKLANYVGRNYEEVSSFLESFNFKSIEPIEEFSDEPAGTIIKQEPEAETEVIPEETDLRFTVSKGKELQSLQDLRGMTESQLESYAKSSGIRIHIVDEEHSSSVDKGKVISQKPQAGTKLEKGSRVDVVLSKGAPAKPIKLLVKMVKIPYEPAQEEVPGQEHAPQHVEIYIQDRNHSMTDPYEEFDITEDLTKRLTIELEDGQRGGYRIVRDNTVILEEMFDYKDAD